MHLRQESSCLSHLRTTAAEHRAAKAGAEAKLLLLPPRTPLPALSPLPLPPLLPWRLRLLGAVPRPPASAGRALDRAEEGLAPFGVFVAPTPPVSPPAAGVPRPLGPVGAVLVPLLALAPGCNALLPPELASACRKRQLGPHSQKPWLRKTTHGCAALVSSAPPLPLVVRKLPEVAPPARATPATAADSCLGGARAPWPGLEELGAPLAGASGRRLAAVPWLLPAPPVLLL